MDKVEGKRVLLISGELEMAKLTRIILVRERNDEVSYALDGYQGLAIAEQKVPDLIFLDLMLPDSDGYEVYRRLRTIPTLQHIPILFYEAFSPESIYPEAQRLGAAGYLFEPYSVETLLAARDAALRGDTYYPSLTEKSKG